MKRRTEHDADREIHIQSADVYVLRDGQKLTYEEALAEMPTEDGDANLE